MSLSSGFQKLPVTGLVTLYEPDLDTPLDIPENRWVDLRLNEIPVEMSDDIQTEEVGLDK